MLQTITITPKWQVYLPLQVRQSLGLDKPGKAVIEVKKRQIIITPQKSPILQLAGKYKHLYKKHPINIDKVRDYIDYSKI